MKRFLLTLCAIVVTAFAVDAQDYLNDKADNILGEYDVDFNGEVTKVRVTKTESGTYTAQVYWVKEPYDKNGNIRLDEKNPDRSLRNVPCTQIVLISGMKYNAEDRCWDGTKVYDPTRGIRANVMCKFQKDGTLRVRGSIIGISQSIYWKPIKK